MEETQEQAIARATIRVYIEENSNIEQAIRKGEQELEELKNSIKLGKEIIRSNERKIYKLKLKHGLRDTL